MSKKEANKRLLPIARSRGGDDYRLGVYITSNPYRHRQGTDDDAEFIRAWDEGWNAARKHHLIIRGIEDGEDNGS